MVSPIILSYFDFSLSLLTFLLNRLPVKAVILAISISVMSTNPSRIHQPRVRIDDLHG